MNIPVAVTSYEQFKATCTIDALKLILGAQGLGLDDFESLRDVYDFLRGNE